MGLRTIYKIPFQNYSWFTYVQLCIYFYIIVKEGLATIPVCIQFLVIGTQIHNYADSSPRPLESKQALSGCVFPYTPNRRTTLNTSEKFEICTEATPAIVRRRCIEKKVI